MSEIELFEARFGRLLRDYAAAGSDGLRPETLSSAVEAAITRRHRSGRLPAPLFSRLPALATAAVIVLAVAIALGVWAGNGWIGPAPTPSPSPTPTPVPTWGPGAVDRAWPGPVRTEPLGGAPDVSPSERGPQRLHFSDLVGDVGGAPEVDISSLELALPGPGRGGESLWIHLAGDLTEVPNPAEHWIAYGVVIDADADGTADFRIGMDNAPGDRHREWVTDLHTGETQVNPGPTYGYGAFGTAFDTFYTGAFGDAAPLILFYDPDRDTPVRFYAWASVIANGAEPATDFAPSEGWVYRGRPSVPSPSP